ncbi:hypothetical protein OESDEN_17674 [Oesophagostomum dentatum]|uniref:Cyclin N-terminal domain-containing protein n=1 Tax=Oesophagostomum dentatum TaxID=61180 RepID=A0A0B1SGL7_OESDE|nr:hypothetical protein OESDEN_17674 [Oesophagostomum dentatum]
MKRGTIFDHRKIYVNCVAAACLSLAKKLCEDHEEDASLYLQRLRLSYSARELKRMELRILDLLGWDAHLPSFDRFLVALLKSMGGEWLMSPLRYVQQCCFFFITFYILRFNFLLFCKSFLIVLLIKCKHRNLCYKSSTIPCRILV